METIPDRVQQPPTQAEGWSLIAESNSRPGKRFIIPAAGAIIGHDPQCAIVIAGSHLSKRHAHLQFTADRLVVRDLDSANGTFVNDKRISQCTLQPGDRLRLDVYSFRIAGPGPGSGESTAGAGVGPRVNAAPAASNATQQEPRQWITRPTSPGNRAETQQPRRPALMLPLSIGLCVVLIAVLGYIVFSRL